MKDLLERLLLVEKEEFNYDELHRTLWYSLIKNEQKAVGITFDLENDERVGELKEIELDLKHPSGEPVRIFAQLYTAGGDWEDPVGYFRCQEVNASKNRFVVIPNPDVNENLVTKDDGYKANDDSGKHDWTKIRDIENNLWDALKEDLMTRLKPVVEEWDVNYSKMRLYTGFPKK